MNMYFREGDKEAYVSHTRVKLPKYKDELILVLVYGLSEEKAMMLLTNKKVKDKRDVHQVVRKYIKRWRIEEGGRFKKTEHMEPAIQTLIDMNYIRRENRKTGGRPGELILVNPEQ